MSPQDLQAALALPAGPELDAVVERLVFGRESCPALKIITERDECPESGEVDYINRCTSCNEWNYSGNTIRHKPSGPTPPYSTDMGAAWRVVEALRERGWYPLLWEESAGWNARVERRDDGRIYLWGEGDTAPLSVCRAALRALQEAP